jgi:hypothetical protein
MFKIDGEWKKMKQVTVKGKPFASPVFDDYFGTGDKGYRLLQEALMNKINEELK